jgi:hypothetical protein
MARTARSMARAEKFLEEPGDSRRRHVRRSLACRPHGEELFAVKFVVALKLIVSYLVSSTLVGPEQPGILVRQSPVETGREAH